MEKIILKDHFNFINLQTMGLYCAHIYTNYSECSSMTKVAKLNIYNKSTLSIVNGKQMTLDFGCSFPFEIPILLDPVCVDPSRVYTYWIWENKN